jgi:hypothetical protein
VKTCLVKDPDERWQSAHDVVAELRWIAEGRDEAAMATRRSPRAIPMLISCAIAALLGAGVMWLAHSHDAGRMGPSLYVAEAVRFTHEAGLFESPSWSPDGRLVAFASNHSGNDG